MSDEILWVFHQRDGAYINGVPARDLTAADLVRLYEDQLVAVENSGLYHRPAPQKQDEVATLQNEVVPVGVPVFEPNLTDELEADRHEGVAPKKSKGMKE